MRTKTKKRMVYNGIRLREGKNEDWYETEDGKIVVSYPSRISSDDRVLFEYSDFSEEELDTKTLYLECCCGVIVPQPQSKCNKCQISTLKQRINDSEHRIRREKQLVEKYKEEISALSRRRDM